MSECEIDGPHPPGLHQITQSWYYDSQKPMYNPANGETWRGGLQLVNYPCEGKKA